MPNLNRVFLMGNLTRDPELRYLPSNMAVAAFGIAVNRRWRNQQGEQQEETTFVDCDAWGKQAELINQYIKKGRPIFIEGRLRLDQWQDKEGHSRSRLKVVVENFQFVDSRGGGPGGGDESGGGQGGYEQSGGPSGGGQQRRAYSGSQRAGGPGGPPRNAPGGPGAPGGTGGQNWGSPPEEPHQAVPDDDIPF